MKPRTGLGQQESLFDLPSDRLRLRPPDRERPRPTRKRSGELEQPALFEMPQRLTREQLRAREQQLYDHWTALVQAWQAAGAPRPRPIEGGLRYPALPVPANQREQLVMAAQQVLALAPRYAWTAASHWPQFSEFLAAPYLERMLERGPHTWRWSDDEAVRWCLHLPHLVTFWDKRLSIPEVASTLPERWPTDGPYRYDPDLDWDPAHLDPVIPDPRWFHRPPVQFPARTADGRAYVRSVYIKERPADLPAALPQRVEPMLTTLWRGRLPGAPRKPVVHLATGHAIGYRAVSLIRQKLLAYPEALGWSYQAIGHRFANPIEHLEDIRATWSTIIEAAQKEGIEVRGLAYLEHLDRFLSSRDGVRAMVTDIEETEIPPNIREAGLLRPFQRAGSRTLHAIGGGLLADETGMGKTVQYVGALSYFDRWPALVLARPDSCRSTSAEIQRWRPDLSVAEWTDETLVPQADVVVLSHAALGSSRRQLLLRHPWLAIVLDESHFFNNPVAVRSRLAHDLSDAIRTRDGLVIAASGTPLRMHVSEMWSQLRLMGRHNLFVSRASLSRERDFPLLTELWHRLGSLVQHDRSLVQDDLPELVPTPLLHVMDARQSADYRAIEEQFAKWVAANPLQGKSAVFNRLFQLDRTLSSWKISQTVRRVDELTSIGQKVLVFGTYPEVRRQLIEQMRRAGIGVLDFEIVGDRGGRHLEEAKAIFQDPGDDTYMAAVLSATGSSHGHTLTAATALVVHDLPWGMYHIRQMAGRAYGRLNDAHGIVCYLAAVPNTLDDLKMRRIGQRGAMTRSVVEGVAYQSIDQSIYNDLIAWVERSSGHSIDPSLGIDGLDDPQQSLLPPAQGV